MVSLGVSLGSARAMCTPENRQKLGLGSDVGEINALSETKQTMEMFTKYDAGTSQIMRMFGKVTSTNSPVGVIPC